MEKKTKREQQYDVFADNTEEKGRQAWGGQLEFLMAALSLSVGMGNLWRFPYLCYRNGGGAFLILYVFIASVLGFPLIFMEYSLGQFGREGIVSVWKVCPLFEGIGWGMFALCFITCSYYIVLISWCFYYIFASFAPDVPWRDCGNEWNTDACASIQESILAKECQDANGTWYNSTCVTMATIGQEAYSGIVAYLNATNVTDTKASADEYFHHKMLGISDGIHDIGAPQWQLVLCLLLCWIIVFVCLSRGIESSGKATYVTALFPYFVLIILFGRGLVLPGAMDGIRFYFTPKWHMLGMPRVWADAATQVFFSLSCAWGGQITLASYNNFNNNALRDAAVVVVGDSLTSIFGGVVIFSFIGYMANVLGVPVDKVATQGAGLAFIIYPQAVTTLPISQMWAILFMLMFIMVGIGTQFGCVQTVQVTIVDRFPKTFGTGRRPLMVLGVLCVVMFLLGIPCTTRGGMYVLQLLDAYCATFGTVILAFFICIALAWVYGSGRFLNDIALMLDRKPSVIFHGWWRVVCPALILFILIFTLVDYSRTSYGDFLYPIGYDIFGWCIVTFEILCVPVVMLYKIITFEEDIPILQRIRKLSKPLPSWGPPPAYRTEVMVPLKGAKKGNNSYYA